MPLGRKLAIGSDEARRQRAELRTSYGNKLSNMNLGRLRSKTQIASVDSKPKPKPKVKTVTSKPKTPEAPKPKVPRSNTTLRRIASSFAHVSDVTSGSCAALPHEDSDEDVREERTEVLIRSLPFKSDATGSRSTAAAATVAQSASASNNRLQIQEPQNFYLCGDVMPSRANERWNQIAGTVSTLFRVRRISTANPMSELRRLREQRDLLEAFTRPFLYEDGVHRK